MLITIARGSVEALPIQDILVRSAFKLSTSDQLVVDQASVEGADGQAVGLAGVDGVGADDVACARHVADHEGRAGNVLLHVFRDEAAIIVVAAARRGRDDVVDGLAFEEISLGLRKCGRRESRAKRSPRSPECST